MNYKIINNIPETKTMVKGLTKEQARALGKAVGEIAKTDTQHCCQIVITPHQIQITCYVMEDTENA